MGNKYLDLLKQVLGTEYVPTLHLVKCPECIGSGQRIEYITNDFTGWSEVEAISGPCQACNGKGKVLMKENDFKIWEG